MIRKIIIFRLSLLWGIFIASNALGFSSVYLTLIENNTGKTDGGILYRVGVPDESYAFLLPPGEKKSLGTWVNLEKQRHIYISVLKGDGDPIFIEWGPESAGSCRPDIVSQSIIYWQGAQNVSSNEKIYQTYCLNDPVVELGFKIHPDGTPEIYPIKGAVKNSEM